jgi:uncharacterized protein (DUF1330 family)
MNATIDPTAAQLQRLAAATATGPIVMLNLLRFKEHAERIDGIEGSDGISGRKAYERYAALVATHLAAVGGRLIFAAECAEGVIGPDEEDWDLLALAEYPSRQAFLTMIANPDFIAAHAHRSAALKDSRLVCCEQILGLCPAQPSTNAKSSG